MTLEKLMKFPTAVLVFLTRSFLVFRLYFASLLRTLKKMIPMLLMKTKK